MSKGSTTAAPRTNQPKPAVVNFDSMLAGAQGFMAITEYGAGGKPIYDLVHSCGNVQSINKPKTALAMDTIALRGHLKAGTCAFVKGINNSTQFALRTNAGIVYAGVRHDKDGVPVDDTNLELVVVELNKDFEIPGTDVVLAAGTRYMKALPPAYVAKLAKVA